MSSIHAALSHQRDTLLCSESVKHPPTRIAPTTDLWRTTPKRRCEISPERSVLPFRERYCYLTPINSLIVRAAVIGPGQATTLRLRSRSVLPCIALENTVQVMIRFLTAILLIGRCAMGFLGLEYISLDYYIEVDTEEIILMCRFEAHDIGHDPISDCHLADRTVYHGHCWLGICRPCILY